MPVLPAVGSTSDWPSSSAELYEQLVIGLRVEAPADAHQRRRVVRAGDQLDDAVVNGFIQRAAVREKLFNVCVHMTSESI